MKRLRKIYTTRHDWSTFTRCSSSLTSFYDFVKHNHVKDALYMQHYWLNLYVRKTAKIHATHDKLKIKLIVELYFNIYKNHVLNEFKDKALTQNLKKDWCRKVNNVWRNFVVFMSFIYREHVEKYANRIRQSIKSAINVTMF
jgi:hypothetical protein